MIIKSLSVKTHSGTKQLLHYLFKKEEKLISDTKQKPLVIRKNVRTRSIEKWVKEFKQNEALRTHKRIDSVKAYHTILSFSNKDKEHITEKTLRSIAKEYMTLHGNNNLYIGTAHFDKNHIHLHLVSGGTKYLTGEANRLSRTQFQQLKIAMDAYQQKRYPELTHSLPRHGNSKETKEPKVDRRNGRVSQKEMLLQSLQTAYTTSKSLKEFLTVLKSQGHEPYYRAGKLTGVKFEAEGQKFRFSRLGYDKEKIDKLETLRLKEEKELSELRDIRERQSVEREADERDSRGNEREIEDEGRRTFCDDTEGDDRKNQDIEDDADDSDDIK